jgi:hypothetical protein
MRIRLLLVFVLLVTGCSKSQVERTATVSNPNLAQVAPALPALVRPRGEPHEWSAKHSEDLTDFDLQETSLDGKFDLILDLSLIPCSGENCGCRYGTEVFLATHGRYAALTQEPSAHDTLLHLRVEFDDGLVRPIEWDESSDTGHGLLADVSLYPAPTDVPIGPSPKTNWTVLGDGNSLLEDLLAHKEVLVEVRPGVAAQFDLAGFSQAVAAAKVDELSVARAVDRKAAAQAAAEAQAAREAEDDKPVIDSLNLEDVETRCGEPQRGDAASLAPYFGYDYGLGFAVGAYGVKREEFYGGSVRAEFQDIKLQNIEFVTLWFGEGGQPITKAEVGTFDSNHSRTIDKYAGLPTLMPCLLKGGVAE